MHERAEQTPIIRWTIFGLSILAFALAVTATAHCSFFLIGPEYGGSEWRYGFGLFSYENYYNEQCEWYPDDMKDDFEAPEKAGRAFGIVTTLLTLFAMALVVLLQFCVHNQQTLWTCVHSMYVLATITQLSTFSFFASETCKNAGEVYTHGVCTLGVAGILACLNGLILIVLSVFTWLALRSAQTTVQDEQKKTREPKEQAPEEHDIESPEAVAPPVGLGSAATTEIVTEIDVDGNKKTTKTVTHPDGTKSITILTEMAH